MNTCPHCGEPLTPDTPEGLASWIAFLQAELTTLTARLRIELPERPQLSAQVELAEEHLADAYSVLAHNLPPGEVARLYRVGEPEGGSIDPRPRASCNVTSRERDALRERVRALEAQVRAPAPGPAPAA